MRWDNLRLDDQQAADGEALFSAGPRDVAIPLIERGAVARTFDTPGFRGMTFYEVTAKSVVNRVPESSRMSFRWTINPYRGCQHACRYCMTGQTPILMADGRAKPLADVQVGDKIYGTMRSGFYRRYARHYSAGALVYAQARLPDCPRGRYGPGGQRRPPLPD